MGSNKVAGRLAGHSANVGSHGGNDLADDLIWEMLQDWMAQEQRLMAAVRTSGGRGGCI